MALLALLALSFGTVFLVYLYSAGARAEIAQKAPEYASRLYRPVGEQLLRNAYPVRGSVLFLEAAPKNLVGTLSAMRLIYGVHFALVAAFLAWVATDLLL